MPRLRHAKASFNAGARCQISASRLRLLSAGQENALATARKKAPAENERRRRKSGGRRKEPQRLEAEQFLGDPLDALRTMKEGRVEPFDRGDLHVDAAFEEAVRLVADRRVVKDVYAEVSEAKPFRVAQ